jgi:hypothetical protein
MIDWSFKVIDPLAVSDGFWYGINEGYIKPEEILDDEDQVNAVKEAVELLKHFEDTMTDQGILEEC